MQRKSRHLMQKETCGKSFEIISSAEFFLFFSPNHLNYKVQSGKNKNNKIKITTQKNFKKSVLRSILDAAIRDLLNLTYIYE